MISYRSNCFKLHNYVYDKSRVDGVENSVSPTFQVFDIEHHLFGFPVNVLSGTTRINIINNSFVYLSIVYTYYIIHYESVYWAFVMSRYKNIPIALYIIKLCVCIMQFVY